MNIEEVVWPTDSAGASVMTHDDIRRLQRAIHQLYGCQSAHTATIPLTEQRCGKILWQGEVQIFHLQGHGTAQRCYAWTSRDNNGKEHHTAVLEVPPVDSPRSAVRAALGGELQVEGQANMHDDQAEWKESTDYKHLITPIGRNQRQVAVDHWPTCPKGSSSPGTPCVCFSSNSMNARPRVCISVIDDDENLRRSFRPIPASRALPKHSWRTETSEV